MASRFCNYYLESICAASLEHHLTIRSGESKQKIYSTHCKSSSKSFFRLFAFQRINQQSWKYQPEATSLVHTSSVGPFVHPSISLYSFFEPRPTAPRSASSCVGLYFLLAPSSTQPRIIVTALMFTHHCELETTYGSLFLDEVAKGRTDANVRRARKKSFDILRWCRRSPMYGTKVSGNFIQNQFAGTGGYGMRHTKATFQFHGR